jgi:uncharacterized membrane protein YedE/YeeE
MHIDWEHFTPWASALGGVLIGLSASIFVLGLGRIAGISGVVGGFLQGAMRGTLIAQGVTLTFLLGLVASPLLWSMFRPLPPMTSATGTLGLLAAGLLVGVGVRMGNGCTSGHGVCGLSRLSIRSLVNVVVFMIAGMIVVFITRHVL